MSLPPRSVLLGVTGGIAAYKAAELARLLKKEGWEVRVVMTPAATHFIAPLTFQALTGRSVLLDPWQADAGHAMDHIAAARAAQVILIAPASADFLSRLATGAADDLLSTLCLARNGPLAVAPAMNQAMWNNPATQRNVRQLRDDGVVVLGPASGDLACGEEGAGRMVEPAALVEALAGLSGPKPLAGRRVLVSAGPTFEAIDAVRGITNLSSGKMGHACARAALEAGAEVTLVTGPTCLAPPAAANVTRVTSAQEMLAAIMEALPGIDAFISVAAVADYYVLNPSEHKIKKDAHILTLELAPNPDILANVANLPNAPLCVGFAAESENLREYAELKRRRKRLPLLVGNLVQDALGTDEVELTLFSDAGEQVLPRAPKLEQARRLVARIADLLDAKA
jgi:phosphopantothenoylcysteine decarboxylase/phosphopantothenate--cysteine ligase